MLFIKKLVGITILVLFCNAISVNGINAQWQPDVRLTHNDSASYVSRGNTWSVAANNDTIHVVWWDQRDGNYEIYYKRSTNGGIVWEEDVRLTKNPAISGSSSIAVSGNIVHVVWNDNRTGNWGLYYKRSTNAGSSWSEDMLLTPNGNIGPTTIAVTGLAVNVAWSDARDGNDEIYYMHSSDGGLSWSPDSRLTFDANFSEYPSIAIYGKFVHIAWWDSRDGSWEIYYKRSTDEGVTWGPDMRLTFSYAHSQNPCIAVSGTYVHLVWFDDRDGNLEIYYKQSTDSGITWSTDTRLTDDPYSSGIPCIAVSGSNVNVVWNDSRDMNIGFEIYYKYSSDAGMTWSPDTRLTDSPGDSWSPSLAVSGNMVHVVWHDTRDGNFEIYYKSNPTGVVPVELNSFSTNISNNNITLNWETATEVNNMGFNVERSVNKSDWTKIAFVQGHQTSTSTIAYSYVDNSISKAGIYFYRLKQLDNNGSFKYSNIVEADFKPPRFELSQNYPNPLNPATKIRYSVPQSSNVMIKVFNILGAEIKTLVNEEKPAGTYELTWNAANFPSGIYFYRMQARSFIETKKMILLK